MYLPALAACIAVAALAGDAVVGRGATPRQPQTIATVPGDVDAFAQDGELLAWARGPEGSFGPGVVEILSPAKSTPVVIGRTHEYDSGAPTIPLWGFALASTRVLVATAYYSVCGNTSCNFDMYTAALNERGFRKVGRSSSFSDAVTGEAYLPSRIPVAGDGSTLAYFASCFSVDECGSTEDAVRSITGERDAKVADSAFPTALATDDGRIAAAVLTRRSPLRSAVNVWDSARESLTRFMLSGQVMELGMSGQRAALLVRNGVRTRIELRNLRDGSRERRVPLSEATKSSISIAGTTVVFQVGNTIRVLDTRSGRISVVAVVRGWPIGLSIERNRVVWAERLTGRPDLIRSITVSR